MDIDRFQSIVKTMRQGCACIEPGSARWKDMTNVSLRITVLKSNERLAGVTRDATNEN